MTRDGALVQALILAITAPTEGKRDEAVVLAESLSAGMSAIAVARAKRTAADATKDVKTLPGRPRADYPARYQLRHSPEQRTAWQAAADREQRELQNWIRVTLDRAAKVGP